MSKHLLNFLPKTKTRMFRNSRLSILWSADSAGLIRMRKKNAIPTSSSPESGSLFYRSMSNTFPALTLCGVFDPAPSGNALHLHGIRLPVCITILSVTSTVFFSHSWTRAHGFLLFVWLLSVCHQQAYHFPTVECVILAPVVLSPSRKHTVFFKWVSWWAWTLFPGGWCGAKFLSIHSCFCVFCEKGNVWWLPANNTVCAIQNSRALPHHMGAVM